MDRSLVIEVGFLYPSTPHTITYDSIVLVNLLVLTCVIDKDRSGTDSCVVWYIVVQHINKFGFLIILGREHLHLLGSITGYRSWVSTGCI